MSETKTTQIRGLICGNKGTKLIEKVTDDVWRGSRPEPVNFAYIKATFSTVISLEGQAEDIRERNELDPTRVLSQPISFWQIYFTGITEAYLNAILGCINAVPKPVLVHCEHGQDRTGLVIAAYRVTACGWTKELAMDEALTYGYRDWLNLGLNKTWEKFQV